MHGDRASELTGEAVSEYFEERGIRVTETAGYEPNANGRAESAVGVIKTKARVMLMGLGPMGKALWPAAVQHACWCTRRDTKCRKTLVPAFGETITAKIKNVPHDSVEARGKDVKFLGCLDKVTAGVLTGTYNGEGWDLEVFSTYVLHGVVEPSAADGQEEIVIDEEELDQPKKKTVTWHSDTYLDKTEVPEAIAEPAGSGHRSERSGVKYPRRSSVFVPKPETTYRKDIVEAKDRKNPKGKGKGKCKVPDYVSDSDEDENVGKIPDHVKDAITDFAITEHTSQEAHDNMHESADSIDRKAGDAVASDPADPFAISELREVTCPACLGRRRSHDHSVGCRLAPPAKRTITCGRRPIRGGA